MLSLVIPFGFKQILLFDLHMLLVKAHVFYHGVLRRGSFDKPTQGYLAKAQLDIKVMFV